MTMIISKEFTAICRGCKKAVSVYEYVGLEGGRYGSHHCPQIRQLMLDHPRIRTLIEKLREVPK